MKLPLAYYGDPILRKKASPVTDINDNIRELVADMIETMQAHNGCGLAAPQVHQSLSLFITSIPYKVKNEKGEDEVKMGPIRVFINPKIVSCSSESWACDEGCLSIPGIRGTVMRPLRVTIQATDMEGNTFIEEFDHFPAHVIMHENDHLNGVLYIDRLSPKQKQEFEKPLREIKKKYSKK